MRAPGSDYILEDQVGHLLRRAHQRATAIFLEVLGEAFQITPTQYAALVKLHDAFVVRVGLSYKFGDPWGKAPVVAKY